MTQDDTTEKATQRLEAGITNAVAVMGKAWTIDQLSQWTRVLKDEEAAAEAEANPNVDREAAKAEQTLREAAAREAI